MDNQETIKNQQTPPEQPANQEAPKETIREIHHHHYYKGRFFPRFFWGIFIIFIGVMFLAQSAGVISGVNLGEFLARIWPVFIILAGLSIMSRGGFFSGLISVIILIIILALVGMYIFGLPIFGHRIESGNYFSQREAQSQEISVDRMDGTQSARVKIDASAGQLTVTGGGDKLVGGRFTSNVMRLETSSRADGAAQIVEISTRGSGWNFGGRFINSLDVSLSTATPVALAIDGGAASQILDLTGVQLAGLDIHSGASSISLALGENVPGTVNITGGASSVRITLPKAIGVKAVVSGGLSSRNFVDFKQTGGNTYQSNNYDQAAIKAELNLSGGASSYTIDWR